VSEELESQAPEEFAALSPLSDNEDGFEAATCLFRNTGSSEMQDNLTHMAQAYSCTIPFADRLINTESFLHYLHTLVSVFYKCLFCYQERRSKSGLQDHMRGKRHCKLDLEDEESEFWEFYDSDLEGCEEEDDEVGEGRNVKVDDSLRLLSGKTLGSRSQARPR
jgi:pre-60S factor REI1